MNNNSIESLSNIDKCMNMLKDYYKERKNENDLIKSKSIRNHLELFSIFLSHNSSFKYNFNYLQKSIYEFDEMLDSIYSRKKFVDQFAFNNKAEYGSLENWLVIFDSIFIIEKEFEVSFLNDFINNIKKMGESKNDSVNFGEYNTHSLKFLTEEVNRCNLFNINIKRDNTSVLLYNIKTREYLRMSGNPANIDIMFLISKELSRENTIIDSNLEEVMYE